MQPPVAQHHKNIRTPHATRGLAALFASTFFTLMAYFMVQPWLLLQIEERGHSTAFGGWFAACGWLGIMVVTPFASAVTQRWGQRLTLTASTVMTVVNTACYLFIDQPAVWFAVIFCEGVAAGLRWVLAEAMVAEMAPSHQRGRWVGLFESMVGFTFVLGPALLALVGVHNRLALWVVLALALLGLLSNLAIPPIAALPGTEERQVGWRGMWQALRLHPVVMAIGFVGGFFENGLASLLPLYGVALGLGATAAALLVSASGLGSTVMMMPAGMLADHMGQRPNRLWDDPGSARHWLMRACALLTLGATLAIPWVGQWAGLLAGVAFVWGAAGGSLYTLAMVDIGSRETGVTLVSSTAVLVFAYTLGGMLAPALGGMALTAQNGWVFTALLTTVAVLGTVLLFLSPARSSQP
ncbi:MFS transporter [Hydrogenophaga sp. 5NK40-0174]|uniref:MFS transporter n=1 Tax=Hydrogenophaga sp. 5NK40-0174 TaxID=3127649 RepID=UPI0031093F03